MATVDNLRVSIIGYGPSDEQFVTVLHYALPALGQFDADSDDLDGFADQFISDVAIPYLDLIGTEYTGDRVEVIASLDAVPLVKIINTDFGGATGNSGEAGGPIERCILINKFTATMGRAGRGRIFVPFPPAGCYQPDGQVDLADPTIANVPTFIDALKAGIPVGIEAAVVGVLKHGFGGMSLITDFGLGFLVGMQRDRRFGVGL